MFLGACSFLPVSFGVGANSYSGRMKSKLDISDVSNAVLTELAQKRGSNWFEKEWIWTVHIEHTNWRIDVGRKNSRDGDNYVVGSDGSATYSLEILALADGPKSTNNDAIAVIELGVLPNESFLPVHPLWLAFCAPRLLESFPGDKMPSLDVVGGGESHESRIATFPFRYELFPQTPFYFKKFEMSSDGYIRDKQENGQFVVVRQPAPYDQGFVRIRLQTEETKQFSTGIAPSRIRYERLRPAGQPNGALRMVDTWTMEVETSNITNCDQSFWLPKPTGNTDVHDRRFAQSSPPAFSVDYRLKSASWPAKSDPFVRQRYEASVGVQTASQILKSRSGRNLAYVFVTVSVVTLLVVIFKARTRRPESE